MGAMSGEGTQGQEPTKQTFRVDDEALLAAQGHADSLHSFRLSLVFTVLAAAIQSGTLTEVHQQCWLELGSWFCLLVSAVTGFICSNYQSTARYEYAGFRLSSQLMQMTAEKTQRDEAAAGAAHHLDLKAAAERTAGRWQVWHTSLFLGALPLLAASRAILAYQKMHQHSFPPMPESWWHYL